MEWVSKIIEVLKSPTKLIAAIFLVSNALLFLPDEVLSPFKSVEFSKEYGSYIGIAALVSGGLLLIEVFCYSWSIINSKFFSYNSKKNTIKRLKKLDSSEKEILQRFRLQNKNTLQLSKRIPAVPGLIDAGILHVIDDQPIILMGGVEMYNIKMSDFVNENLTDEILDLPNGKPSEKVFNT